MIYFSRLDLEPSPPNHAKNHATTYIYIMSQLYIYTYIYIYYIYIIYIICYKYICKIIFSQLILKFSARLCHTVRRNNSGYDIKRPVKYLFSVKFIFGWKGLFEKDRC